MFTKSQVCGKLVTMIVDAQELYSKRMFVFLETEPQRGKFQQILFTKNQFQGVSLAVSKVFPVCTCEGCAAHPEMETISVSLSDTEYPLPDLQDYYSQEYIDEIDPLDDSNE